MKVYFVVHREENVNVFTSQVLEYLKTINENESVDAVELILFSHAFLSRNKKKTLISNITSHVSNFKIFKALPVLCKLQLSNSSRKLKRYLQKSVDANNVVICRGDFSAYIASNALKEKHNYFTIYDNRGVAIEESTMSHGNNFIYKINRKMKLFAMQNAKEHCSAYNFVTNNMRDYLVEKYGYIDTKPFTIIPTLVIKEDCDQNRLKSILDEERIEGFTNLVTYVGSSEVWQMSNEIFDIFKKIVDKYGDTQFLILTNAVAKYQTLARDCPQLSLIIKKVPHSLVKYYLQISDLCLVIRDDSIVNKVAAPTKIAEYLLNGCKVLYKGDIGIIDDIKELANDAFINLNTGDWLDKIFKEKQKVEISSKLNDYFDMKIRQLETLQLAQKHFESLSD